MTIRKAFSNKLLIVVIGMWLGVVLGVAIIGGIFYFDLMPGAGQGSSPAIEIPPLAKLEDGSLAPDFELENLAGQKVRLSDLKGKLVLVNFWASWCIPCVQEMPTLQAFQQQYPGITVLGINLEEDNTTIQNYLEQVGATYEILLDREARITSEYRIITLPTTFIVDEKGMIRYRHIGYLAKNQLQHYFDTLGVVQ